MSIYIHTFVCYHIAEHFQGFRIFTSSTHNFAVKILLIKYMYGDLTFTHGLTTDDKGLHNTDPSSNRCSLYISDIE